MMVVCERDPDVTLTRAYGTRLLLQGLQIDELCLWILSEVPRQKGTLALGFSLCLCFLSRFRYI